MDNIQDILTKHDLLLLSIFALIIIFLSVLLKVLISKSNTTPVILKYEKKEDQEEKEPVIKMALAADNIEDIERSIKKEKPKKTIEEQDMENQTVLENVLKAMNEDLEKERYAKIDAYEEEQEKEAVISYQELRNKMMKKEEEIALEKIEADNYNETFFNILDKNESEQIITPYEYDFNFDYQLKEEPTYNQTIVTNDVIEEPIYNTFDTNKVVKDESYSHTFETKEFISPIYGKMNTNQIYSEIEKNDSVKDLSLASDTDEFLNTLKEFRNSL